MVPTLDIFKDLGDMVESADLEPVYFLFLFLTLRK